MSSFVKSLDSRHMVAIGSEGFFGTSTPRLMLPAFAGGGGGGGGNPAAWAADAGQDFLLNNMHDAVDFATLHVWPDNWGVTASQSHQHPGSSGGTTVNHDAAQRRGQYRSFIRGWLESHIHVAARKLRKPLLLEEFGKRLRGPQEQGPAGIAALRDPVFEVSTVCTGSALCAWCLLVAGRC